MPRFYCAQALQTGASIALPATAIEQCDGLVGLHAQNLHMPRRSGGQCNRSPGLKCLCAIKAWHLCVRPQALVPIEPIEPVGVEGRG
jgi:hypothetical protein